MFSSFMGWVDARFPATKLWEEHLSKYYAPKNFNFWYFFGAFSLIGFGTTNCHRHILDHALQA